MTIKQIPMTSLPVPKTLRELEVFVERSWEEYEKRRQDCGAKYFGREKRRILEDILGSVQRLTAGLASAKIKAEKYGYNYDDVLPEHWPEE